MDGLREDIPELRRSDNRRTAAVADVLRLCMGRNEEDGGGKGGWKGVPALGSRSIDVGGVKMKDKSFGQDNLTTGQGVHYAISKDTLSPHHVFNTVLSTSVYSAIFCSLACNCARFRSAASRRSLIACNSRCSFSFSSLSFRRFDFRF